MSSPRDPGADDELTALAGEYVLGTLSSEERAQVRDRLGHDRPLRAAVDAWEARLHPLVDRVTPLPLPDTLWERIDSSIRTAPAAGAAALSSQAVGVRKRATGNRLLKAWQSLTMWRTLTITGFAMAAVLASLLVRLLGQPAPPPYLVVLVSPDNQVPGWVVQANAGQTVTLRPLVRPEIPAGKSLQFWTKADGWNAPVSLGLARSDQPLVVPMNALPPLQSNQLFELTLEPSAGSPTGRPTGPIQFIGRAVPLT